MGSGGSGEAPKGGEPRAADFVGCAAEELKVPITAVLGYVELLQRSDVFEDAAARGRILRSLQAHARELQAVAESMSGACAVTETRQAHAVDCAALVADAASVFGQASGVGVVAEIDPATPCVSGDRRSLLAALHGLLRQTSWGAARGGLVRLGVRPEGEDVRFVVSADPAGAPDVTDARPMLGEWIARHVAAAHGGTLELDHARRTAMLTLPAAPGVPR